MGSFQFIEDAFSVDVRARVLVQPETSGSGLGPVVLSRLHSATSSLYDLGQVIYFLWASVASSVK